MVKDMPSPCCGSFHVDVRCEYDLKGEHPVMFSCHCGECGVQYGTPAPTRAEALYNYDRRCIALWRENPDGLQDWMKRKQPEGPSGVVERLVLQDVLKDFS